MSYTKQITDLRKEVGKLSEKMSKEEAVFFVKVKEAYVNPFFRFVEESKIKQNGAYYQVIRTIIALSISENETDYNYNRHALLEQLEQLALALFIPFKVVKVNDILEIATPFNDATPFNQTICEQTEMKLSA